MGRLENKVAIITGGGGGIGAATAKLFVQEGAKVLIVGRTESKLKAVVEEINSPHISYFVADVSKAADAEAYTAKAIELYGKLDVLVANAGVIPQFVPVHEMPEEAFDRVMDTNTKGVWLSAKNAIPEMQKVHGGSIVFVGSTITSAGFPKHMPYTASKHAVTGIMRSAFLDVCPDIRINVVSPGAIDNELMVETERNASPDAPNALRGALEQRIPMKRYGKNEEIAQSILFLASDESSYITGINLVVDGGFGNSLM